ncbi:hypothetical protein COOONC_14239 [Cooperia oncophora]
MLHDQVHLRRSAPVPPAVSDYIVLSVLRNEKVLIRTCKNRMITTNHERRKVWEEIAAKIRKRFNVMMTSAQVQTHFNNRRKRTLYSGQLLEKTCQPPNGALGIDEIVEKMNTKFCEIDAQLYRYYAEHAEQQSNQNATTSAPRNYDIRQRPPMRFDALLMESDPDVSDDDDDPMYEPPPNSKNLLKNEVSFLLI